MTLGEPALNPLSAPTQADLDEGLRGEVMRGLQSMPKNLPARLLYDGEGSALFERIALLDEYYLTRAEVEILRSSAAEIASLAGSGAVLIEYGSGAGVKARLLLNALEPSAYVPVDYACEQLGRVAGAIAFDYPGIWVRPLCADYTLPLRLPAIPEGARRVGFFPGSTVGNFHPSEAATFLRTVRRTVGPGGVLLLGVDRRKDPLVLDAAYNDSEGVTARFNLNVLTRLNRDMGAGFDLSMFQHRAFYNADACRIEMHLVATEAHTVRVSGTPIHFERGETIRTEYSYKYDEAGLYRLASAGGFALRKKWSDSRELFWVAYLEAKRERSADWRCGRRS